MRFRFDVFTLDDGQRQLLEGDQPTHLTPKAYELLKLLLLRRPKAIAKADLHDWLWPTTFVADVNLTALMAELRAALRDQGRHNRFIRTVHGFGYAFSFEPVTVDPDERDAGLFDPRTPVLAPRSAWLTWGEREYALRPGAQTIGRDPTVDVRIDALSISRVHARLTWEAAAAMVEDLGSKNGSWVNGSKVGGVTRLEDGDELRLGSVTLTFRNIQSPGSTVTVAAP